MKTVETKRTLHQLLQGYRNKGLRLAFVPTMGALHPGHIALVKHAKTSADIVVCSIFVNPTQFNEPKDLEKYPRPIEKDVSLLEEAHCDVLFLPAVDELYQDGEQWHIPLGHLNEVLEGKLRPGHFQGVTQVVKKLLDAVQPDVTCFGQKDFQQFKVVEHMINFFELPVTLEMCPTVREPDGLAMSSRNVRLTERGREQALALYRTLLQTKADVGKKSPATLQLAAITALRESPGIQLEYFAIYDAETFRPAVGHRPPTTDQPIALVAAWVDGVRLIDNMLLD